MLPAHFNNTHCGYSFPYFSLINFQEKIIQVELNYQQS